MGMMGAVLEHPEDLYVLAKMKMAAARIEKQIPPEPHWAFCYTMLQKVSRSFAIVIQQLGPELRNAVCIFYLVLRALDTVEDDTSIPSDIKVPILESFHCHIYDRDWHFSCGTKDYKVLMDKFHFVSTAFLELGKRYQVAIEDITKRMGVGMAKFICKEVETVDDYDEYCHYVAGLVGLGLSKLFHASGLEELASDSLSNSMGLFLQKTNIIRDYLEDINEIPKSRMFWPRQIWSKYANKLEDFKYEENSTKAVQCLNDMVTNALMHAEDCLQYMSALKDIAIFRFCAIPQVLRLLWQYSMFWHVALLPSGGAFLCSASVQPQLPYFHIIGHSLYIYFFGRYSTFLASSLQRIYILPLLLWSWVVIFVANPRDGATLHLRGGVGDMRCSGSTTLSICVSCFFSQRLPYLPRHLQSTSTSVWRFWRHLIPTCSLAAAGHSLFSCCRTFSGVSSFYRQACRCSCFVVGLPSLWQTHGVPP